jgi:hypothetical protein
MIYWFYWWSSQESAFPFVFSVGKVDVHAGSPDYRFEVHLRTLSTNEPHPKALIPISPVALVDAQLLIARMEISGNMLVLLYQELSGVCKELEIWNWVEIPHKTVCFLLFFNPVDSLSEFNSVW